MPLVLANARLVLPEDVVVGAVTVDGDRIIAVDAGEVPARGTTQDLAGDFLLPGLIDLHSDQIERHYVPRTGVTWPAPYAVLSHDAGLVSCGITTVFDSLALTGFKNGVDRGAALQPLLDALTEAGDKGLLRTDHLLHLRCEVTEPDIVERFSAHATHPRLRLASLMDHSPGQRQFRDTALWYERYRVATGLSDGELDALRTRQVESASALTGRNRAQLASLARSFGSVLASHDDGTPDDVLEAARLNATISEFPTTLEAAKVAKRHGLSVVMGAPNLIRGGSHVENVSAIECAAAGVLDILASDYVPGSLLAAAFQLARDPVGGSLAWAVSTVTSGPARALGLADRGSIAVGKRADLVQVRVCGDVPVVGRVWRAGRRVH